MIFTCLLVTGWFICLGQGRRQKEEQWVQIDLANYSYVYLIIELSWVGYIEPEVRLRLCFNEQNAQCVFKSKKFENHSFINIKMKDI